MNLALTHNAFRKNACRSISFVPDCCLMHSQFLSCSLQFFNGSKSLVPIDSDDEQEETFGTLFKSNDAHRLYMEKDNIFGQDEV